MEALFELRWDLKETGPGLRADEHYKLLLGRIYDRVQNEYPYHEQLPSAIMPDEIAAYIVQHRFRTVKDGWPLVQVGPGIVTVNDTEHYEWDNFRTRIERLVSVLFEVHPEPQHLSLNSVELRYIDAVDVDFECEDILRFLGDKLKVRMELHPKLFEGTGVSERPIGLDAKLAFASTTPPGAIEIRFARGTRGGRNALVWETLVRAVGQDAPAGKDGIIDWARQAHELTHDWFFKTIEGDLERSFR